MSIHPLAGRPAPSETLIDVAAVERAYYRERPDPSVPAQRVSFGTSGHRGSPLAGSFTEAHVLAITQAVCDYRRAAGIGGTLYLGKDTHAVSGPAEATALEVLAGNGVTVVLQRDDGVTPTPVISRAIVAANRDPSAARSDGIVVTPSHNPPADGGIKYNPPHGGPAESSVTTWIEDRANDLLAGQLRDVRRIPRERALAAATTRAMDLVLPYVLDLDRVLDLEVIRSAGLRIGIDAMGGAAAPYWAPIAEHYGLDIAVEHAVRDPTFAFMTLDHDGRIRMDCSSPYAMTGLVALKDRFDVAFGNDADADRHGIVTPRGGLMNPNHYLAVCIDYLIAERRGWSTAAAIGKTVVSSSLIDRVAAGLGRRFVEVPVGFKWFAPGLADGSLCFAGEESAGASFVRRDGATWTTDKDGLLLGLLAAEMTARTGIDPAGRYEALCQRYGVSWSRRIDSPVSAAQKHRLAALDADDVSAEHLAGEPILARITRAPGNGAPLGGLKVVTENGWFAARPSGTEAIYKLYAESFVGEAHLDRILDEAADIVGRATGAPPRADDGPGDG